MGKIRDSGRTRKRILDAAGKEFSEKGFDGARIAEIARRARVSKQLVHHHFGSKEGLFQEVHVLIARPSWEWEEALPQNPADLIAERFERRARNTNYVRILTWEAASVRNRSLPAERERQRRISQYGVALRLMQAAGRLPGDMDHRLLQLAIVALASYPLAFSGITRLITGHTSTHPQFRREWSQFLRRIAAKLFSNDAHPATKK